MLSTVHPIAWESAKAIALQIAFGDAMANALDARGRTRASTNHYFEPATGLALTGDRIT